MFIHDRNAPTKFLIQVWEECYNRITSIKVLLLLNSHEHCLNNTNTILTRMGGSIQFIHDCNVPIKFLKKVC